MVNTLINNAYDGSGERLFCIRKALGMTQIEFAKIVNSSNGHVSDMEKNRKNITESTIELLKLKCNVNEDWLRTGAGEMFSKTPSGTMEQLKKEFDLDDFSFNLVYEYLKLAPAQREKVRDFFYNVNVIEKAESVPTTGDAVTEIGGSVPEKTVAELEEEYKKTVLRSARKTGGSSASSTTEERGKTGTNN